MLKRGLWSPEEDEKLVNYISTHGRDCRWSSIPKLAGSGSIVKTSVFVN
ncbi:putative transcription factor MYB-related family [Helianthus annuus]|uniref:Transcription factor MYB-related family n=1 Tax=Helianthus annuus TaxID=4232 RepID=A0A9K3J3S4_HELAN|nr:putative transcription factor MYB-related family [Helianthus annuus]KAJ0586386.1 putative transcription factor MYB-related family [Helianthus annuus]KAJ0595145.1 putative transcription factor MYB-related family [Helianthus annuus]KAJ0755830.1 putative transcription factor MYB-related family [Helianthus annuus]KAJ0924689.1 putative transcription factor MYB-related family [Helianthus annuus]